MSWFSGTNNGLIKGELRLMNMRELKFMEEPIVGAEAEWNLDNW